MQICINPVLWARFERCCAGLAREAVVRVLDAGSWKDVLIAFNSLNHQVGTEYPICVNVMVGSNGIDGIQIGGYMNLHLRCDEHGNMVDYAEFED